MGIKRRETIADEKVNDTKSELDISNGIAPEKDKVVTPPISNCSKEVSALIDNIRLLTGRI